MGDRKPGCLVLFYANGVCHVAAVPNLKRATEYVREEGSRYENWEIRRADNQWLIRKGGARCRSK